MRRTILLSGVLSLVMGFVGTLLALAVALPELVGAQEARIRAEQFTIVGDNNADRIRLQTGPGIAAALQVFDASGNRRAQLATGLGPQSTGDMPVGAGLNIYAASGQMAGRLGADAQGSQMVLNDANGRPRLRLRVTDDGTSSIEVLDANGNATWSAR